MITEHEVGFVNSLLDKVAKGELIWFDICSLCNREVDNLIKLVKNETKF